MACVVLETSLIQWFLEKEFLRLLTGVSFGLNYSLPAGTCSISSSLTTSRPRTCKRSGELFLATLGTTFKPGSLVWGEFGHAPPGTYQKEEASGGTQRVTSSPPFFFKPVWLEGTNFHFLLLSQGTLTDIFSLLFATSFLEQPLWLRREMSPWAAKSGFLWLPKLKKFPEIAYIFWESSLWSTD